jgi:signal transduction histidine kinase
VEELKNAISSRRIEMVRYLAVSLPKIRGDEALLNRAFENLIKEAILSAPEGEQVTLSTSREGDLVVAVISHPAESVSEEDLAQFFFPRFTAETDSTLLELPLSKIIVHRHGGRIDLHRQEGDVIVIRVELPIEPPDQPGDTAL